MNPGAIFYRKTDTGRHPNNMAFNTIYRTPIRKYKTNEGYNMLIRGVILS